MSQWVFQVYVFRDGQFLGTEMVTGDQFDFGRDPQCSVVVQDEGASRRHARIYVSGGEFGLQDLGSSNGTFVNGVKVDGACAITPRDEFKIGRHSFKFKVMTQGSGAEAAGGFGPTSTAVLNEKGAAQPRQDPDATELDIPLPPQVQPPAGQATAQIKRGPMVSPMPSPGARMGPGAMPPPMPPVSDPTNPSGLPNQLAEAMRAQHVQQQQPQPLVPRATSQPPMAQAVAQPAPAAAAPALAGLFDGVVAAHDDHDEDDDDEDGEEHIDYSLVDLLAREDRLQGARTVAEVMLLDGDALQTYTVVPQGGKFQLRVPVDGTKKVLKHLLLTHKKGGVELNVAAGMAARFAKRAAAEQEVAPGSRVPMMVGDTARLALGRQSWMVRVVPAPEKLAEVARGPLENLALKRLDRKVAGISGGGSVLAHFLLFGVFFVASLLSPTAKVTQLEDEFAEIQMPEVKLEEPPPPEPEPPPPQPEPPPPEAPPPEPKPQKRAPVRVSKNQPPPTPVPEAPAPKPGILAALTKLPTSKNAGSQTALAAVSNINAVKVPGGQAGFKVSALIGKGPANAVQIGGAGGGTSTKSLNSMLREGGVGVLGGKGKGPVRAGVAQAVARQAAVQGELSREEISKVINQHMGEIQFCYEKELLKTPGLQGKVVFEWTIKTDGRVLVVKTKVGGLPSAGATNCMIDKIKTWVFPKPRGNGMVVVTYPFIFKQSGF